jgi:hypothetical protein
MVDVSIGEGKWSDVHGAVRVGRLARINVLPNATRNGAPGVFILTETTTGERMIGTITFDLWDVAANSVRAMAETAGLIDKRDQPGLLALSNGEDEIFWVNLADGETRFFAADVDPNIIDGVTMGGPLGWRKVYVAP